MRGSWVLAIGLVFLGRSASAEPRPRVLILPATTAAEAGVEALDQGWLGIFSDAFYAAASLEAERSGWEVVGPEALAQVMKKLGSGGRCPTSSCVTQALKLTQATHWISESIVRVSPKRCRTLITRYDFVRQRIEDRVGEDIVPCNSAWLERVGSALGLRAGHGDRARAEEALGLTGRQLPDLDAHPLPELPAPDAETSSATLSAIERRSALEKYRSEAIFLAATEDHRLFVLRGGASIDDCRLLELDGRPVSPELRLSCQGNWWELAWIGVPVGGLFLVPTTSNLIEGGSPMPFVLAALVTIISPIVALSLNEDAIPVDSGRHALPYGEILAIADEHNAALLRRLGLVAADVKSLGPVE